MKAIQSVKEIKVAIDFGDTLSSVGRLALHDSRIYKGKSWIFCH